jgi:stalled ribosome rescue protein Dom34
LIASPTILKNFIMVTDWIKWHIDRIHEAANSKDNPHQMLGRIQHNINELMKFYEDGILIHHKKRSTMKKPDELKHFSDPGEVKEETKGTQDPAAEVAPTPETGEAAAAE